MRTVAPALFLLLIMPNVSSMMPTQVLVDKSQFASGVAAMDTIMNAYTIQDNIEKYRKGDLSLRILDHDGTPLTNKTVAIRQLSIWLQLSA